MLLYTGERNVLDRKQLAADNRKLAESAGQMLHTLIQIDSGEVKKLIINAIIATVQQPGSQPPDDVPALMAILRSAAEEQLALVQSGDDASALQMALEFGRWIKVPTILLGEARNRFKAAADTRREAEKTRARRAQMGMTPGGGGGDGSSASEALGVVGAAGAAGSAAATPSKKQGMQSEGAVSADTPARASSTAGGRRPAESSRTARSGSKGGGGKRTARSGSKGGGAAAASAAGKGKTPPSSAAAATFEASRPTALAKMRDAAAVESRAKVERMRRQAKRE